MALLPTGSNKLLEINTEEVNIVVKSKKPWGKSDYSEVSSVVVEGRRLENLYIKSTGEKYEYDHPEHMRTEQSTKPLFFEQTDYEIVISGLKGNKVSLYNDNHFIQNSIGIVRDGDDTLISGVINFGNIVGYTDFDIYSDNRKNLSFRIEVFPSKISYKDDYILMLNDISEMVCEVALDFMQKTYQTYFIGENRSSLFSVYFQILSVIFRDYIKAVNRITAVPHHKLVAEHDVVPAHKAKRTDRMSEKWIMKHPNQVSFESGMILAEKVLTVKKQVTYDTSENRFVKFILSSTVKKLETFKKRYIGSIKQVEKHVIADADHMIFEVRQILNRSFLHDVSMYSAAQSMSLVFGMAPGYRELYKCYTILQRCLSVNGDVFKMSPKDTAQLYEYWCFIKLFSLLKKTYELKTPDIIKVDNNGITVTLVKGVKSEARFINPATGELITLAYNPSESKTQTVNQKPDNVLELQKIGTDVAYKYVFDAKYRIESAPDGVFYPDSNPGPKVDDINTMHRYRDSIVYENPKSKFTFEKTMFGAYILFPYEDEKKYAEVESIENGKTVKGHKFYRSIDSVNIGGLPFLPGSTRLVQILLSDLINDSKESAFERTTLPRGIEEKLAIVDWSKRDVLIGTFSSVEQFSICFNKKFYYVPERKMGSDRLPIHWVALYQTNTKFACRGEIRYYGEVIGLSRVKRKNITEIPMTRNNPEEVYYRISIKQWKDITEVNVSGKPIYTKESGFVVNLTNMFLLEHSETVSELQFKNEEEYRFYSELKRTADKAEIRDGRENIGFYHGNSKFVFERGEILVFRDGKIVERIKLTEFARRPSQTFRLLRDLCSI